jgi:hypothetical protein
MGKWYGEKNSLDFQKFMQILANNQKFSIKLCLDQSTQNLTFKNVQLYMLILITSQVIMKKTSKLVPSRDLVQLHIFSGD